MFVLRQLFDPTSSTYTYLLADSGQAVLIDPVFEQTARDSALLRELGLQLVATLDTHVHADHVTVAWLHRQRSGSRIVLSKAAGAVGADTLVANGDTVGFGTRHLQARATPGHTLGCTSWVLDDLSMAFTGDTLLIRGCGRTDFQQGNASELYRSVHEQLFTLPAQCLLYPGHDYRGLSVSSVAEERIYNPRLGGSASEADFAGYMNHLGLPHPKLIDVAVPANLRCGEPLQAVGPSVEPTWAPLTFTFGGIWEIAPDSLAELAGRVQVVDVREAAEFTDTLGHIPGALLLPLAELDARKRELQRERPVVTVCRSGARSAQACVLLTRAGFPQVANLAGGMLRWRAQGHDVDGGDS
ncbi:MAG: rhodanese-like domain-containing protein [Rubrivivax sp.]|nr:rhodanese-like domain-containing protein [Rubrivivax sp.]